MTPERQNEIWAMLPEDLRNQLQEVYQDNISLYPQKDVTEELSKIFGQYNLTGTNPTENIISDSIIQSESAESVETSIKEDVYFAYRLELAKELAVAVVKSNKWDFFSCNPVKEANKIVKRLKET